MSADLPADRPTEALTFAASDLIMGYVVAYDSAADALTVRTSDGRRYVATFGPSGQAEVLRNLGEPRRDVTSSMRSMFTPGRLLFLHGTFLPQTDGSTRFEAQRVVFTGRRPDEHRFEERNWWINQIRRLADHHLEAGFGNGPIDWAALDTDAGRSGAGSQRQDCDTISRLVYGFASAYLLTGDERYLTAAETGTEYLHEHFRAVDTDTGATFWYHAIDRTRGPGCAKEGKVLASERVDDYDAIPLREQIHALAGPVQTFRATGDPRVAADVASTVEFLDRYFLDHDNGGHFSHVDPVTFDPRADGLGRDRARKNWDSVVGHVPAYLATMVAATGGDRRWMDRLVRAADLIVEHFGGHDDGPFVDERFHEDWSNDRTWGWQQNRAVVGNDLAIVWHLTRIANVVDRPDCRAFARRVAAVMPAAGSDRQRGGWYGVLERTKRPTDLAFPFAWHDGKARRHQEQAILAYLVMASCDSVGDPTNGAAYRRLAGEAAAFYNAWFLDHDSGGVHAGTLADGRPYPGEPARFDGGRSAADGNSFELCYVAATHTNLLVTEQPLELHFKPYADSLPGRTLTVAPDLLPAGSARIARVWIDGTPSGSFDPTGLSVQLPAGVSRPTVKVEMVPAVGAARTEVEVALANGIATLTAVGALSNGDVPALRAALAELVDAQPSRLLLDVAGVDTISSAPVRAVAFAAQKLGFDCPVEFRGANAAVRAQLAAAEFTEVEDQEALLMPQTLRADSEWNQPRCDR